MRTLECIKDCWIFTDRECEEERYVRAGETIEVDEIVSENDKEIWCEDGECAYFKEYWKVVK